MKLYLWRIWLFSVLGCSLVITTAAQGRRERPGKQPPGAPPVQAGVYMTVSGTISQLNYDRDAEIDGFLLSDNTLVHIPPRAALHVGSSIRTGDNVQITGFAQRSPSGVQTMEAQGVQDRTSGKTIAVAQPGAAAPYSGSGLIRQLNYGADGTINGFLLDNGTLAKMPAFGATNPSFVRVGTTIAYNGFARTTTSGRTVVDVQTLMVNGQPLSFGMPVRKGGPNGPPSRPGTSNGYTPPVSAAPTPPNGPAAPRQAPESPILPSPQASQAPAGRTAEPPPPPPPAQSPQV